MIEDVANAIVAALKADLPAQLAAVQAAREAGLVLDAPLDRSYFVSDVVPSLIQDYPAVFVRSDRTDWEDVLGARRNGEHRLQVVFWHSHSEPGVLQKLVWRYVEAAEKVFVLSANRTLGNTVIYVRATADDYSPTFPRGENLMAAGGMLEIEVRENVSI